MLSACRIGRKAVPAESNGEARRRGSPELKATPAMIMRPAQNAAKRRQNKKSVHPRSSSGP